VNDAGRGWVRKPEMNPSHIRLFSTDLDGTLLGNPEACWRFAAAWDRLPIGRRPILVYNTGRTTTDAQALAKVRGLPEPDFIIGSVGTELHDALYNSADDFRNQFGEGWNRELVHRIIEETPGVIEQPAECQHAFKSSWYWVRARRSEVADLAERLHQAGTQVHVDYSCRYFLDVVPARAGKGRALMWLCQRLHISATQVLVAGDTANDVSMFLLPGVHGIIVENALPELHVEVDRLRIYLAQAAMADGVIEGLRHFGVIREPERPATVHPQ
jgi:sucrose-6F-phosphate phosphohydrolase